MSRFNKDSDSNTTLRNEPSRLDRKKWEAKFRCATLKSIKKPSVGMASVDSSAPETTSSDNSPTLERRQFLRLHGGPGSDSGSSNNSSDSVSSSLSADKFGAAAKPRAERFAFLKDIVLFLIE